MLFKFPRRDHIDSKRIEFGENAMINDDLEHRFIAVPEGDRDRTVEFVVLGESSGASSNEGRPE